MERCIGDGDRRRCGGVRRNGDRRIPGDGGSRRRETGEAPRNGERRPKGGEVMRAIGGETERLGGGRRTGGPGDGDQFRGGRAFIMGDTRRIGGD